MILAVSSCGKSSGLEFHLLEDDTYTVIGIGDCEDTELVIPKAHEGKPVTQIDKNAFNGNTKITSVTIPDSVTTVEEGAFFACPKITIHCEAGSAPSGWHENWKQTDLPVVWGYTAE